LFWEIVDWIRTKAVKYDHPRPSYGASDLSVKEMAKPNNQFERMSSMVPIYLRAARRVGRCAPDHPLEGVSCSSAIFCHSRSTVRRTVS
jgi:hypothetical protein